MATLLQVNQISKSYGFHVILENLTDATPFNATVLDARFKLLCERFKVGLGKLLQPIRVAVTGDVMSPGMFETLEVLGKETAVKRFKKFVK